MGRFLFGHVGRLENGSIARKTASADSGLVAGYLGGGGGGRGAREARQKVEERRHPAGRSETGVFLSMDRHVTYKYVLRSQQSSVMCYCADSVVCIA